MTAPAKPDQVAAVPRKSKIVRWQGLLIFGILAVLVAGFWILFLGRIAARTIERTGTALVGAKVELDKADVSFSPLGLTLLGLKVTNPDAPMTNAFEVGRIAFHMDGPNALRRKIIIEEMSVENVRLNTPRKTSGAVAAAVGKTPLEQLAELPSFVIPNVKEVFEQEKNDLRSVQILTQAAADSQVMRTRWEARLKELQAAADVDKYQKQYAALKAKTGKASVGNLLGGAKDVLALQKQVRNDIKTVTEAKKAFAADLTTLKKAATDAPGAVRDDAQRLLDKYALTPSGLANISRALFGPKIAGSVRSALQWNERLAPFIDRVKEKVRGQEVVKPLRAKGRDVRFHEDHPLPDFLARLSKVSVSLPQGDFAGQIENMTSDQDILGQPLKFSFSAANLKGLRSASLHGTFDRVRPDAHRDVLNLSLRGCNVRDVKLVESRTLPVSLKQGLVDLDVSATVEKGRLAARIVAGVSGARLAVEKLERRDGLAGRVDEAIRNALGGISSLSLTAEISGTPDDFDLKVRSDLDDVLRGAVSALVRGEMAGFEKGLLDAINGQVAAPLEKLGLGIKGLDTVGPGLDSLDKRLGDLLKKLK